MFARVSGLARQPICFEQDAATLFKCRRKLREVRRPPFFATVHHHIRGFQAFWMSNRPQKGHEGRALPEKRPQNQEDDYDVYLFWPSLSNRDVSSEEPPSSPLYGVGPMFRFVPGMS